MSKVLARQNFQEAMINSGFCLTQALGLMTNPSGYSGTPLAKKLGIATGSKLVTRHAPSDYEQLIAPLPPEVLVSGKVTKSTDLVHVFAVDRSVLEKELASLRKTIRPDGVVWVSWPKKASKVPTNITEDTIREVCLPLGFVDIKVCAVSSIWSGLKLMIRKELR
jgi:hypothetical protein